MGAGDYILKYDALWETEAKAGRIRLWGDIEEHSAGMAASVLTNLEANENKKEVTLYINTRGGNGQAMWALTDTIVASRLKVTTIVEGCAMSAGCIIAAAGDVRKARPNSQFLYHGAYHWNGYDKLREVEQNAEWSNWFDQRMAAFMAERTHKPKSFWQKPLKDSSDLRFGVDEALEWGVIDEVLKGGE